MLLNLFVWFIFFSFLGWLWEEIYCTIVEKRFENRGFLFGPLCPIYGFSITLGRLLLLGLQEMGWNDLPMWELFLLSAFVSAVAEYITSFYLEKRFHARWWDYSKVPLNLNGRICLPATLGFGLAGMLLVRFLLPEINVFSLRVPQFLYELLGLLLGGILGADIALTEASLSDLIDQLKEADDQFAQRTQQLYQSAVNAPERLQNKMSGMQEELAEKAADLSEKLNFRQRMTLRRIHVFSVGKEGRDWKNLGESLREISVRRKKKVEK